MEVHLDPSTGVSPQPSPARAIERTSTHQDHRLAHPSNQEVEARPEVTKAHPDSEDLEVVVVAYREFRGVAHRPTAEV